jgi:nitrogen-specific signal transduction histidine kinase/CheY-like chemotaxis protein
MSESRNVAIENTRKRADLPDIPPKDRDATEAPLRQSQHLEAVGRLAASMAHDFNNILTIIDGYTSLLLAQRELPEPMTDPLRQISIATERAANLTRQLMIFSRKNTVQPRLLNLNELTQSFGYLLRRVLGDGIEQQFSFAPNLPLIEADPGMMEQVIMNLAINARDAMPQGGKLTIETSAAEINPAEAQRHFEAKAGRFVRLSVSDTGAGMDAETMSKMFEPFFTTKETSSGLGLSAVYGIVKQHGGWIDVHSRLGEGTRFDMFLPVTKDAAPAAPPSPEPKQVTGNETILVVEDEPAVRELSAIQLRKLGYKILTAESGTAALALWPEHQHEIDLLFTDMVMADGMTGRDLAETLQAQKSALKVIYTSGYSLDVVEQDFALRKGVNFLQKPYQPAVLAKLIRRLFDAKTV